MAIILASGSAIRHQLLSQACVDHHVVVPRVDEDTVKDAFLAASETPRNIADALAELKAQKISQKHFDDFVIGCDQTLALDGQLLSKPGTPEDALDQLKQMRNKSHTLHSAVVVCQMGAPIWRHVGRVDMVMKNVSDAYLDGYVERNWDKIKNCVGSYQLEGEGVRLFARIEGDYFSVLGLPLLELLSYLTLRGVLET